MNNELIGIISNEGELKGVIEDNSFNVIVQIAESGPRGLQGSDGKDGYTPIKGIDYFDGSDANVTNTNVVNALGYIPLSEDSLPSNLETTSGSQNKANQAEQNAKNYTDSELSNFEGMVEHGNEYHSVPYAKESELATHLEDYTQLKGDLSTLKTTVKDSIPNIVNELFTSVSNGKTVLVSDIEDKGGTVSVSGDIPTFEELSDGIGTISTGGGGTPVPVSPKDVNFCDYDGTIVASYTLAQAQALSALPTAPDHSNDTIPLTFQEWNYTLEQVKALTEKADIWATYIPTDGKTHLKIRIAAEGRMDVPLYFSQTVTNGVTIDWGDGSSTQKLTGTGNRNTTHTYSSVGDYDITLAVESGCVLGLGINSSSYCVLGATNTNGRVYCSMLQEVNVGERVTSIENYAFQHCYGMASITIPNSVASIGSGAFQYCYSLAGITIPNGVASIGSGAFQYCYSLAGITIPNGVPRIENYSFQNCSSLASITIPNSVASIGSGAFQNCYSLASIIIPNNAPRIENYAFQNCYTLASIIIPNSVASIGNNAFGNCYTLASIIIPNSLTSIGNTAFQNCYGMAIYDFSTHTFIPTLSSTNAFNGIPSDCIMKIPSALFATWETETNWSIYASNMMAV